MNTWEKQRFIGIVFQFIQFCCLVSNFTILSRSIIVRRLIQNRASPKNQYFCRHDYECFVYFRFYIITLDRYCYISLSSERQRHNSKSIIFRECEKLGSRGVRPNGTQLTDGVLNSISYHLNPRKSLIKKNNRSIYYKSILPNVEWAGFGDSRFYRHIMDTSVHIFNTSGSNPAARATHIYQSDELISFSPIVPCSRKMRKKLLI
jgi:hypothetical protein